MEMNSQLKWHINYYAIRTYLNCVKWTFPDNSMKQKKTFQDLFTFIRISVLLAQFHLTHGA